MRKMFTRLFGLALLVMLLSSVTVVKAQSDCGPTISASDVVLVTDITTVCDSGDVQYKVTGFPDAKFAFNWDGDPADDGGYTTDSTIWVQEGTGFTVRVLVNDTCYSNEVDFAGQDTIQAVYIDTMEAEHPQCFDDQGEVTVFVGGYHPPHTIYFVSDDVWEGPMGDYSAYAYTSGTQFAREGGHWYYAAVQGANPACGISEWDSVYVNAPQPEIMIDQFEASTDTVTCIGDEATITVDVSGGLMFGDGTYKIQVGDSVKYGALDVVFDVPAGSYTVEVTDSLGCVATLDSTIVIEDPDQITFDIAIVDVSCGEGANGVIKVFDFTPSTDGFKASIGDGNWIAPVGDTIFIEDLTADYYSLYVKDTTTGCDSVGYVNPNNTQNVVSVQSPGAIEYVVEYNDTIVCYGDSTWVTIDSLTGGSGDYEFSFDGEAWQDTAWAWYVPAGTYYSLVVRDANEISCDVSWPDPIAITQLSDVWIYDVDHVEPTCPGGNDGLLRIEARGGTGEYEYSLDEVNWYADSIFNVRGGRYYDVYIRDKNCPNNEAYSYRWIDDATHELYDVYYADSVVCKGGSSEGFEGELYWTGASYDRDIWGYVTTDVNSVYVEGDEIDIYYYSPNYVEFDFDPWDLESGVIAPGTYYLWFEDSYGCKYDEDGDGEADYITFNVTEKELANVTATVSENATCFEANDGLITLKIDTTTEFDYDDIYYALANTYQSAMHMDMDDRGLAWTNGVDSVNINVGGGTYFAVVWDQSCADTVRFISDSIIVAGYDEVVIADTALTRTHIVCKGDSTGSFEIAPATGGTELVYRLWAGPYMSEPFTVIEKSAEAGPSVVVPEYDSVTTTVFTGLPAGAYWVEAVDLNGCAGDVTDAIIIMEPKDSVDFDMDWMDISCNGASDGKVYIEAYGGTGNAYDFKVGAAPWLSFPEGSNEKTVVIIEPGTYDVWVRDSVGCVSEPQTVHIAEPDAITMMVDADSVTSSCLEDPNGMISVVVNGGNTDTFMIEVIGIDTIVGYTDSLFSTLDTLSAGTYTVIATEVDFGNRGCQNIQEVVVGAPSELEGVAIVLDSVHCNGSNEGVIEVTSVLGGVAPYDLVLFESSVAIDTITYDADSTNMFTMLEAGSYSVKVVDDEGCEFDINKLDISEPSALDLHATWIQDKTCDAPGMFSVQATGGVGNYKYFAALSELPEHILIPDPESAEWQDDSIFSVDAPGTYIVWAIDSNMCVIGGEENDLGNPVNAWRVKIAEPKFLVTFTKTIEDSVQCNGDETADLIVSNIVVTEDGLPLVDPAVTVEIDGVANDTVSNVGAGVYYVTVTHDSTGCSTLDSFVVTEPDALVASLSKAEGMFTCPGETEGYLEVTVTDTSVAPFEYRLLQDGVLKTDFQEDNSFLVTTGKSYTVVVMDANGCTDSTNTLDIVPVTPIEFEIIRETTCALDSAASVEIEVSGEAGRMFQVQWTQIEDEGGSEVYSDTSAWYPAGIISLDQVFLFDNENLADKHYDVTVVDNMGCSSDSVYSVTYDDKTDDPVSLTVTVGEQGDCTTDVTISAAGGAGTYMYMVDDVVVEAGLQMLGGGEHTIYVEDMNGCWVDSTITLEYGTQIVDTIYADVEGNAYYEALDTTLMLGSHVIIDSVDDCEAEYLIEVMEGVVPMVEMVSPTDTIEDNHPTFEIVFDTDVTFNDSVMGYLTVTQLDSAEAYMMIEITEDMVNGNTITVTYEVAEGELGLDKNTTYTVAVDSGVVVGDGLAWDGVTGDWMFTTGADWATDVNDINNELEFAVYPNPFNDFIRIDNADKLDRVVVSNIAGQRILDIEYPSYEIRTGNLVTGVYVVTLISNDEIVKSERIIKR